MDFKYPYDSLEKLKSLSAKNFEKVVDLSVGSPVDEPFLPDSLNVFDNIQRYPESKGAKYVIEAVAKWVYENLNVEVDSSEIALCIGTKEFVASVPRFLKLLQPSKNTVLYNSPSYPTYKMGAVLNSLNSAPVRINPSGIALNEISGDLIKDALCLWVNSPNNPTGYVLDLKEAVTWALEKGVTLLSDECYCDFYWEGQKESAIKYSRDNVLALFSLSKSSNLAGLRVGFYVGDANLVKELVEIRKNWGLMVPKVSQNIAAYVLSDLNHVNIQRERYKERLDILSQAFESLGMNVRKPQGGIYLWIDVSEKISGRKEMSPDWEAAYYLAEKFGVIVSPGSFYEDSNFIRVAATAPTKDIELFYKRCL